MAPPVHAMQVRTFRLAIIEEPSGRVVATIAPVPERWVQGCADALRTALPTMQAAAGVKSAITQLSETLGRLATRPAAPRRKVRRR